MENLLQKTISKPGSLEGKGLHTGKLCHMTLLPASENTGIVFQRMDVETQPLIKADCTLVVPSQRSTTIESQGFKVITIEHLVSALFALGVDNCLVQINSEEIPILDGSAKPFVDLIKSCGIINQTASKEIFQIKNNVFLEDPESKAQIIAMPSDHFKLTVMVDYNSQIVGPQHVTLDNIDDFVDEIAPCRTFVFFHELEQLYNANLIKGGDVNNAIVMVDKLPSQAEIDKLSALFGRSDIQVHKEGYLNNVTLHFQNEAARHKLLDLVGDLALIGTNINAHIIATYPGHKINTDFAKLLKKIIEEKKISNDVPIYDPNAPALYDVHKIKEILPHRFPFLLVDKIISMNETTIIGIKNATVNESFFTGHFPDNHVMPGVLQIEALAQCGGILGLKNINIEGDFDVYFVKIDKVKFKRKVIPGDTLVMKVTLLNPIRRGIVEMKGQVFIGQQLATEAEMVATVVKR
ncbi:MAG: bifunctional UDP-3-O-[3-hydroxymyristoyl] N-acetylglucosamine deacetylase/3-hydroxyacyl-ACP dehydratase [Chitinophagales bacterium]|jgi:UDP-3-O-[3-hydroxymyristoyl] N-acetylglucosamine deacetylase/3-hydroxyacyl-[acyl-carrier-protein] dehydratase|nr:bifunctional UDP-3-O-[3-hydroxymyristoyl] N-acetylglucosamine deacetylase/3-hydroxyacyl-ACP dehydratase [Chitinophagales bacterium]